MDEAALIRRCKTNDAAAQKLLYMRFVEDMMLLSYRYLPSREDASEVVMDSFLSMFRNIGSFKGERDGSLKAWLRKIVVNRCLDHLRKRNVSFASKDVAADVKDDSETALDTLTVKEIMQRIHALPDGYRTVFNLYVFEGMNHREIGDMLYHDKYDVYSTPTIYLMDEKKIIRGKRLDHMNIPTLIEMLEKKHQLGKPDKL